MGLKRCLSRKMACHPTHNLAHMPVFNIGTAVIGQIGNILCKGPGRRMKAKGGGAQHLAVLCFYLDIAVNGFGDAETLIPEDLKCCARKAALVLESSPPMITNASRFKPLQTVNANSILLPESILVRPVLIMLKPPMFRWVSTSSGVISMYRFQAALQAL